GRGKTTLARALHDVLRELLPALQGQPLVLSLDDYYLPKSARERTAFRARGYELPGLSNRGPAGTHDVDLLWRHLQALGQSGPKSRLALPVFDKQTDDRFAK